MAGSTITLEYALDTLAAKGVPDPRSQASGYGDQLAIELGSQTMADLLSGAMDAKGNITRFNWKFNRAIAPAFQLNSWQQDYPQLAMTAGSIGWGEECDILDINNTVVPKPLNWDGAITWNKQLPRTSRSGFRARRICWMYNRDLSFGTWPGAGVTFYPLNGLNSTQNPIMSMIDKNGNMLIVTTLGTTGSVAPFAPVSSAEGTVVTDNTVRWTVVDGSSQGFRVDVLPNATSPNYQIIPYVQLEPPRFASVGGLLSPVPDSFSRHFFDGLEARMFAASPNPGDAPRGQKALATWLNGLLAMTGQANKEPDVFSLIPISSPVERRWLEDSPRTADNPI
jgi:hypothetical protein